MAREITVVLKPDTSAAPKSSGRRVLDFLNELVKSPLFVFLFGASAATLYPAIKTLITPDSTLEVQRLREEAREDAVLIAPFVANLDADEPGKFEASRAALQALALASKGNAQTERPMFIAVNSAIQAVAVQLRPPTDKKALTPVVIQEIANNAAAAPPATVEKSISYSSLKDAIVYIQVSSDNAPQQDAARKLSQTLRSNSVITPAIENLAASIMPNKTQVRYFHDSDRAEAETLAEVVRRETNSAVYLAKPNLSAKPGTLEVWFAKG
jgi:hypothetical protein